MKKSLLLAVMIFLPGCWNFASSQNTRANTSSPSASSTVTPIPGSGNINNSS